MDRHGADAARLFLVASSQISIPRRFDEGALRQLAGNFLVTLRNVYAFFAQYANFGYAPSAADPAVAERPALDRWVLGRLARVEAEADALLEAYDPTAAARRVMEFFDADVSKWYVRLSRPRFWFEGSAPPADARAALATLHEVLVVTARLLAPFAPFVTDWLHRALTGGVPSRARTRGRACIWPTTCGRRPSARPVDEALDAAVESVRRLATLGRAAREAVGINVRQPLGELVAVAPGAGVGAGETAMGRELHALAGLLAAELNVRQVRWATSGDALVSLEAKPNFRHLGKRFGKATPRAAAAVAALAPDALRAFEHGAEVSINVDGAEHALEADDLAILRRASGAYAVQEEAGFVVALDPTVTPELKAEGVARELVSRVQRLRKEAGLQVSDRIRLRVAGPAEVEAAAEAHAGYIAGEVLATAFRVGGPDDALSSALTRTVDLDGAAVHVSLSKDTP
jgi:isoleucyl-tRNA synthetase